MTALGSILTGNSSGNFGITVLNKTQAQNQRQNNSMDLLFDTKSFTMPKPGIDGNPFGGIINY